MLAAVFVASCGKPSSTKTAESIVDSMSKGDFASVTANFDSTMKSQLSTDQLGLLWSQLTAQFGPFKSRTSAREAKEQGLDVVYVTCQFEKSNLDVKVVFDNNKQIAGFFLVPSLGK
jgi:hypothetical protein